MTRVQTTSVQQLSTSTFCRQSTRSRRTYTTLPVEFGIVRVYVIFTVLPPGRVSPHSRKTSQRPTVTLSLRLVPANGQLEYAFNMICEYEAHEHTSMWKHYIYQSENMIFFFQATRMVSLPYDHCVRDTGMT